jgi:hypothetical protein
MCGAKQLHDRRLEDEAERFLAKAPSFGLNKTAMATRRRNTEEGIKCRNLNNIVVQDLKSR